MPALGSPYTCTYVEDSIKKWCSMLACRAGASQSNCPEAQTHPDASACVPTCNNMCRPHKATLAVVLLLVMTTKRGVSWHLQLCLLMNNHTAIPSQSQLSRRGARGGCQSYPAVHAVSDCNTTNQKERKVRQRQRQRKKPSCMHLLSRVTYST